MPALTDLHPEIKAWQTAHWRDLWMLDKLILSRALGYTCGPAGQPVPAPGRYVVRPCVNARGMGEGARIEYLTHDTEHLPPGTFWCEAFEGQHLSVDYAASPIHFEPVLCVQGFRDRGAPLWRWNSWVRIPHSLAPRLPNLIAESAGRHQVINAEFIDDRLIEVHFRRNTDFDAGNTVYHPVWFDEPHDRTEPPIAGATWRDDFDGRRIGAWVA